MTLKVTYNVLPKQKKRLTYNTNDLQLYNNKLKKLLKMQFKIHNFKSSP